MFFYCKAVTTGRQHWPETQAAIEENRRIGISLCGIYNWIAQMGGDLNKFSSELDEAYKVIVKYDHEISALWGINTSIKRTTEKPSGTTGLLFGLAPGMHAPQAEYYIRRFQMEKTHAMFPILEKAGIPWERVTTDVTDTMRAFMFPVHVPGAGSVVPSTENLTIEYQFELMRIMQEKWADNQLSCTVTFQPEEVPKIARLLEQYEDKLKGVSLFPKLTSAYAHPPYQTITKERYEELSKDINLDVLKEYKNTSLVEEETGCGAEGKCLVDSFLPKK
jgi:ribonucleoside-triphosphate reductase